jgi:hypothetical protein
MTQTSVIAANAPATTEQLSVTDAAAAQAVADATAAQAAAATAQASATTAFNTAVAANTAASTAQATADGKNKVTYSTTTPGATANAVGDIWFQYGTAAPNVGRIIAQFTGNGGTSWTQTTISGLVVANLDAGSITTGTLSVALGITGTGGNFSVNAVTGALVATSATITGAVNALSGYFGTSTNGYSITSTGLVGVGSGVIIGGQIQTSSGNEAVILNGSANAIQFKAAGSVVANMLPLVSGGATYGLLMHYGATPDSSGGTRPQIFIGSASLSMFASSGIGISVATSIGINMNGGTAGTNISGPFDVNGTMRYPGATSASGSTLVLVSTGSRVGFVSSSRKTKKNITALIPGGYLDKVLSLEPSSFDWLDQPDDMPYRRNYGLMAEDTYEIPEISSVVNLDQDGEPITISYDRLTPFLVMAIKELTARLEALGG